MIGKKFGMFLVIKDSGKRTNDRGIIWICKCNCGSINDVSTKLLKNEKKPRSCGCSRKIKPKIQFYSQIDKSKNCWEWTGTLNKGGYGKFRGINASKVMWEYEYGKVKNGLQVLHTCDNRKCVNPDHLFLGTISDNMRDKTEKNRQAKGSKIGCSILNEENVLEIRKQRMEGFTYTYLAEKYAVDWYNIRKICKNESWKHVDLGDECKNFKSPNDKNQSQH
jgi:hypothetical protein